MRSTPGMDSTGMRLPFPSVTNIGQIRSAGVSTFSATSRRDQAALRLRRMRTAGKRPASACGGASAGPRASGSARRWGNGLASGFMGAPLPWAASATGCRHCGQARRQGKGGTDAR